MLVTGRHQDDRHIHRHRHRQDAFAGMGNSGCNAATAMGSNPDVATYCVPRPTTKTLGNAFFANGIATFAKGGTFSNSIVSSPTLFKFADGGTTRTGLMGEAGPEAIMPLKRGSDGSLGRTSHRATRGNGPPTWRCQLAPPYLT
jgi:lambda family phage tail tape measure protein